MVLSQHAWTSDSPLFDAIEAAGSVPPYKDVALHHATLVCAVAASPLVHPRIAKLGARVPESPLSALHDRHASPGMSSARRALFSPGGSIRHSPIPIAPKPPQAKGGVTVQVLNNMNIQLQQALSPSKEKGGGVPGGGASPVKVSSDQGAEVSSTQTSPQKNTAAMPSPPSITKPTTGTSLSLLGVADLLASVSGLSPSTKALLSPGGGRVLESIIPTSPPIPSVTITGSPSLVHTPLRGQGVTPGGATSSSLSSPRPRRTGSLALFYRKTYQLAYIRIKDLCERLSQNNDFVQK